MSLARTKIEVQELREEHEELEDELSEEQDQAQAHQDQSEKQWTTVAVATLAALQPLIKMMNMGDTIHSPAALSISSALVAAAQTDFLSQSHKAWATGAATVLEGFAYFDAREGLQSILSRDDASSSLEAAVSAPMTDLLARLVVTLEGIQSALESQETADAIGVVSSSVTELTQSITGASKSSQDALVPALKTLNSEIDSLTQSLS